MAGVYNVKSMVAPDKDVREAGATEIFQYLDFVTTRAMAHPGPAHATVSWILERDRATRLKARSLHQAKWPWGEAMESSYTKH
eukprot:10288674-Karenia_brevis.AAC.1